MNCNPNTGVATGLDLDGDGHLGGPGDAQGLGAFAGQGGMALMSRLPIDTARTRDFTALLRSALPGNPLAGAHLSSETRTIQHLPETGARDFTLHTQSGALRLDYVLPSPDLHVTGSGTFWPATGDPLDRAARLTSRHRLV